MSDVSVDRKIVQYGLSEVYSAPDPQVDIVFVHGLNGHPHHTWASRNPATFWPGDLLPLALVEQRARILAYGYDANIGVFTDGASEDKIHNHAEHLASRLTANRSLKKATERPIIFVCHSLGGLVVKRCLIYCNSVRYPHTEQLRSIYVSTYGILFLGTPHNGSDLAKWRVLLQSICDAMLPKQFVDTSPQLIQSLKTNNETLQNINRLFIESIGRYRVFFFHELRPTELKGKKEFVVDEDSSAPIIEGVERAGIQRDHSHMCKFEDENTPGYNVVAEAVQRYSGDAPAAIAKKWIEEKSIRDIERREAAQELLGDNIFQLAPAQNSSRPLFIPTSQDTGKSLLIAPLGFRQNSLFFGFQIELDQLHRSLFSRKKRSLGTSAVLLWGPPGCGKTHLVREFVFRNRDNFPQGVFWVDCKSQEAIHKSIWDIAQAAAISDWDATSQYVQAVRRWFEAREGWLIVFDGVTFDSEDDIKAFMKFIPDRTENGIIFTSVDRTLAKRQPLLYPDAIKVAPLSVDDARRLLYKVLDIKRPTSTQEAQATELVKYFECLPLAIYATGHMLSAKGKALENYHAGSHPASKRLAEPYTEIIQDLWDNEHHEAINMINLLSFFGHSVPVAMLQLGRRALDDMNVEIRSLYRERSTRRDLESTIATLIKYGLAERTLRSFNTIPGTRGSLKAQLTYMTRVDSSPELTWDAAEADTKQRGSILESSPIRSTAYFIDVLQLHTVVQGICRDEMRSKDKEKLWWWLIAAVGLFCLSYSHAEERIKAADGHGLVRDYREYETHAARLYSHFPKDQNMASTNLQKARHDLRKVMRSIKREIEDGSSTHSFESARRQVNISIFKRTSNNSDAPETPESTLSRSSTWDLREQTQTDSPRKLRLMGREAIYQRAESGYDSFPEDYDYESGFESLGASIVTERRPSIPENIAGHDKSRPESTGPRTSFLKAIFKGHPIQAINKDLGPWRPVPAAPTLSHADFRATASKASSSGASSSKKYAARPNSAGSRAEAALTAIHRFSPAASRGGRIRPPSRDDSISAKRTNARGGANQVSGWMSDASFRQVMRDRQAAAGSGPNRDNPSLPVEENVSVTRRIPPSDMLQALPAAGSSSSGVISQQPQYIPTGYTSQPMSRDASQESAYSLASAPAAAAATGASTHSPIPPAYMHPGPAANTNTQFPRMGGWSDLTTVSPPTLIVPLDGSGNGAEQFGSSSPANLADDRPGEEGYARILESSESGDFRMRKGIGIVERPPAALREQMQGSQKSNAIKSSEKREDDLIQAFLFGGRDLPQSQVDDLLRQLVDERTSNTLTIFLEYKPDTVGRLFPWAPALLDEGFSCAEVSELIINSENLQWLESEPPTDDKDRSWAQGYSPSHLASCAHEICCHARKRSRRTGNIVSKTEQSLSELNIDMVSESEVALHQREPATVHSSSSRSSLSDLEDQFSKLEEREHNMTSICGTAGVFSPSSRPSSLNPGFAVFTGAIAKIVYAESEQASGGAAVERQNAGYKQASWISCALDNVIYAISKLNRDGGCCDSFSIFVHCASRPRTVRASTISRHMVESLRNCLKGCLNTNFADSIQVTNLAERCRDFFSTVGQSRVAEEFLRPTSDLVLLSNKCRHLCALVAQIASVGIVTYTRGHSREFVCDQLSRSVEKFLLLGTVRTDVLVTATRVRLTCLDAMLSRPVWAFQIGGSEAKNLDSRFSVSTSIERLLDLWGGRLSFLDVPDDPGIVVQVGGGTLTEAPMPADTYRGAVLCHWSPSIVPDARPIVLKLDEQIIIGATLVNDECSLSADLCHSHISSSLEILGARSPRWKTTGRNISLSGGQYVTATMGVTQTRDNGRTRKARILEHWKDHKSLKILNEPVGLELSLCTGVARRVPLRTLFHGQVLEYFMSALDDWKSVKHQASGSKDQISVARLAALIGETTTNAEMHMLLDDVLPEQAELLKKGTELLLLAMECTGVAEDGESLVMWWPEIETPTPRGLKIPKRYYSASSKHGPWTSMIKDSESCAVFGMVTSRCLQHHGLRPCQTLGQVPVSYRFPEEIVLDTSLSPAGKDIKAVSVSYELGQRLLLWQRKEILRVTRAAQNGEDVVRLELYAALPPAVARLIGSKWKLVREQQALKDQGQNVLVL